MLSPQCVDCPLQGSTTMCHPGIVCKVDIEAPECDEMGYDKEYQCPHEHTFQQEEGVTCSDCGAVL